MRMIDADELLKHKGDCYDKDGNLMYAVGTGDIMAAPTVGVDLDAPHVPDVGRVIDNMRVIRTWASCGAITQGDCPSVTKILDDALALIEAQRRTLDDIDKYVRELDEAVNSK